MPALPLRPVPLREESGRGRSSAAQCRRHPLLRLRRRSGIIRGAMPQASASTPREAEREIIRGAMPQASASTPREAEREIIRDSNAAGIHGRGASSLGV